MWDQALDLLLLVAAHPPQVFVSLWIAETLKEGSGTVEDSGGVGLSGGGDSGSWARKGARHFRIRGVHSRAWTDLSSLW